MELAEPKKHENIGSLTKKSLHARQKMLRSSGTLGNNNHNRFDMIK